MTCVLSENVRVSCETFPKYRVTCTNIKGIVEDIAGIEVEAIKARMKQGLDGRMLTWLAERTGDDYKNLQRWITGPSAPPIDFAARYAAATGVSLDWLLTGTGAMWKIEMTIAEAALQQMFAIADRAREAGLRTPVTKVTPPPQPLPPGMLKPADAKKKDKKKRG